MHLQNVVHCTTIVIMSTTKESNPNLLTTREVAEMVGRNEATITRWVASGKLSPMHKGEGIRGAFLFRRNDVHRLLSRRTRASKR